MKIAMTGVFVNDPMNAHTFYTEVQGLRTYRQVIAQLEKKVAAGTFNSYHL